MAKETFISQTNREVILECIHYNCSSSGTNCGFIENGYEMF